MSTDNVRRTVLLIALGVILCVGVTASFVGLWRWLVFGHVQTCAGRIRQAIAAIEIVAVDAGTGDWLPDPTIRSEEGEPLGSWRFYETWIWNSGGDKAIPPYDVRAPWTQVECRKLRRQEWCWNDSASGESACWTNVMAIVGPDTGFDLRYREKLHDCDDLIILMEVANSGVHWAEPGDRIIDDITQESLCGIGGDGVLVGFLDGQVWFLRKDTPVDLFKEFCTATGARTRVRETELAPYGFPIPK